MGIIYPQMRKIHQRRLRFYHFVKIRLPVLTPFILFIIIINTLAIRHSLNIKWLYFWDSAGYHYQAISLVKNFHTSFQSAIGFLRVDMNSEYPSWWALPLALFPIDTVSSRVFLTLYIVNLSSIGIFFAVRMIFKSSQHKNLLAFFITSSPGILRVSLVTLPDAIALAIAIFGINFFLSKKISERYLGCFLLGLAFALRKTLLPVLFPAIIYAGVLLFLYQILTFRSKNHFICQCKDSLKMIACLFLPLCLSPGIIRTVLDFNSNFRSSYVVTKSDFLISVVNNYGYLWFIVLAIMGTLLCIEFRKSNVKDVTLYIGMAFCASVQPIFFNQGNGPHHHAIWLTLVSLFFLMACMKESNERR
jgi:hypothetical protein